VPPSERPDRVIQNFRKKTVAGTQFLSFLMTYAQIEKLQAGKEIFSGLD